MDSNLQALYDAAREAHAARVAAERASIEAHKALNFERLRIKAAGGKDVGLAWPLGTILTGDPDRGRSDSQRYVLDLNHWGEPMLYVLTKSGERSKSTNPFTYNHRSWVPVAAPVSGSRS